MSISLSQRLKALENSGKTVFTTRDLRILWQETSRNTVIIAKRMLAKGLIFKLAKGYYSLGKEYDIYELANLIISPSYVSLDSALFYWNICFQMSDTINSVALLNYKKKIRGRIFQYRAMKKSLFYNLEGIQIKENVSIATPERAILDSFYYNLLVNIDNPKDINFTFLAKLASFYPKTVFKKAESFIKAYAS